MSNSVLVEKASGLVIEIQDGATVLEVAPDEQLLVESSDQPVVAEQVTVTEVTVDTSSPTVLEVLHILPTETISEDEMTYAKRVDFVTDLLIYRGEAAVGTLESEAVWRIRRLTLGTDDDVTEEWANGNANFTNVWEDRASLSYS